MKFSTQEEYGIRFLIRIGKQYKLGSGLTIPEISNSEGISHHNTAKILRVLRLGGFLESERGKAGGYTLSKAPDKIIIGEVLAVLGGKLFDDSFCLTHSGITDICTHTVDCSARSLWKMIQISVDSIVRDLSLEDLLGTESDLFVKIQNGDSENFDKVNHA